MFIYNIHTLSKTFALPYKEGEGHGKLIDRICTKLSLQKDDLTAVKEGKDGAGLVYEFEGGRWALDDDDDLQILHSRLPPDSTPSATIHLNLPHAHAHFASATGPPAYTSASSAIKTKAKRPKSAVSKKVANGDGNGTQAASDRIAGSKGQELGAVGGPVNKIADSAPAGAGTSAPVGNISDAPVPVEKIKAMSMLSGRSRRSKWGEDDREPLGDVHKRLWLEFQSHQGVRTVMGRIGNVSNVRMLMKPGYRYVYVSRNFAIKNKLVPANYAMGASGYTGLKTLGAIPITVGSRTQSHPALINEEQHFDVVLGRSWLEKMGIKPAVYSLRGLSATGNGSGTAVLSNDASPAKAPPFRTDPLDQTVLTYMDTGEAIPCDLVVLKDAEGNVVTIT
ncbi:MAG: hypothetical protein TREMPRED_004882 [Tremellales sp. Tagirdzhanova-0007]|nr:MAG: hypothetical protein TREMPRED_004882 [Tremellales sp. Tagirdzhanova-0007]